MITPVSSPAAAAKDRSQHIVASLGADSIFVSEVVDSTAHTGQMIVSGPLGGVLRAYALGHIGNGAYGPRRIGTAYPPHTSVVCYQPPQTRDHCYVIAALPTWITSGKWNLVPDWIVPACRSGLGFDRVHWGDPRRENKVSGDINFAGGAPCDELPGDTGYINELGISYGIGRLMAWLRASHFCGVEAFYADNLLRLLGYNLEEMTSGSERRVFNDEGEFTDLHRWGPYPWETAGVRASGQDFTKNETGDWLEGRAGYEPQYDDQAGIWRVQEFKGYLGDIRRTLVALPLPDAWGDNGVERMSQDTILPGLLDQGYGLDGSWHVRSAKRILLEKAVVIPIPKEKIAPDDATGDRPDNYKAAGAFGDGTDHTKTEPEHEDDQAGLRSMMMFERHALLYSFHANLPFIRHTRDWLLPTEAQTLSALGLDTGTYDPSVALDNAQFWMPLPKSVEVDIDHRGKTKYYSGRAFVTIEEDGSIVAEDAYGSQVRLEGGNAFVSARNDVILQPGRNAQIWAPHDIILKAGNSIDMTASQGDIRMKAQGNLHAISVDKGILLEAQDDGGDPDWEQVGEDVESRGILLRAMRSKVMSLSRDAYFRAGAMEGVPGELHLDSYAGEPGGNVYIHGGTITNRAMGQVQTIIGSTGESDHTVSMDLTVNEFVFGGKNLAHMTFGAGNIGFGHEDYPNISVEVLGHLFTKGHIWVEGGASIAAGIDCGSSGVFRGSVLVDGSGVFTGNVISKGFAADNGAPYIGETADEFRAVDQKPEDFSATGKEQLDSESNRLITALSEARQEDNEQVADLKEHLYAEASQYAGEMMIDKASFSYRTAEQYGTATNFKWFESRWQQMGRLVFGGMTLWREESLVTPQDQSLGMPYPGYEAWSRDETAFVTLEQSLYDLRSGHVARQLGNDEDEDRAMAALSSTTFSTGYVVTLQENEEPEESEE